jgi:hypothetical protein
LLSSFDDSVSHLDVMSDDARPYLAEASQLTESLRLYDSSYHSELDWWTAPFETSEGIPDSSLVSATESDRVDVGRLFPVSVHKERRTSIQEDHSKVLVLSTDEDTRKDPLRCGEVLSTVLLECTMAGMAACPLTHMTELAASRNLIGTLTRKDGCTPGADPRRRGARHGRIASRHTAAPLGRRLGALPLSRSCRGCAEEVGGTFATLLMAMADKLGDNPLHATVFAEDAHLFVTTVRDNLLVARGDATDDELRIALRRVGIEHWLDALPDGLSTGLVGRSSPNSSPRAHFSRPSAWSSSPPITCPMTSAVPY